MFKSSLLCSLLKRLQSNQSLKSDIDLKSTTVQNVEQYLFKLKKNEQKGKGGKEGDNEVIEGGNEGGIPSFLLRKEKPRHSAIPGTEECRFQKLLHYYGCILKCRSMEPSFGKSSDLSQNYQTSVTGNLKNIEVWFYKGKPIIFGRPKPVHSIRRYTIPGPGSV